MDIFSHALWGGTIIRKKPYLGWALFLGAAPDIIGSGPAFLFLLFAKNLFWDKNTWVLLPSILKTNYYFWHSLLAIGLIFFIIILVKAKAWFLIIPYIFHIVLDLFTHRSDVLSRLFFPFVEYNINRVIGQNWWEHPWIWILNWVLLIGINIFLWLKKRAVV